MPHLGFDVESLLSARATGIDVSGIRRVFELGRSLADPIDLSIGQPDFPVPDAVKDATIEAIRADRNGYTLTQGAPELLDACSRRLRDDVGWDAPSDDTGLIVTSGTSGALLLACLATLDPGDEIILPDPYFVIYPALARIAGAKAVYVDTYPDGLLTAERVEACLTDRTKLVFVNAPGNPSGAVLSGAQMRELVELTERHGALLVSDEIYDEFTFSDAREGERCPSPARSSRNVLLVRGLGKTYGCTGWRLGFAAGPAPVIQQMAKLQQYTFVCAPSMAQVGAAEAFAVDMSPRVAAYEKKRDLVAAALGAVTNVMPTGGAFYAFAEVPPGFTGTSFAERAIESNVLVIPGGVFSRRDTHFRLSFATSDEKLAAGLDVLTSLYGSGLG